VWSVYGTVGVGGAGVGGVMKPRNTRKGLNSSSLELEFETGTGDCWVRDFDRINGVDRIER
jgi:hypothetical protein